MKRATAPWTTVAAVATALAFPIGGAAQSVTPAPAASGAQQAGAPDTTEDHQQQLAAEHLREAARALAGVRADGLTDIAQTRIAELKRRMAALENAAAGSDRARREEALATLDRTFDELLGTGSGTNADPGKAVGTSGVTVALDEQTKDALERTRTHLAAYAGATGSVDRGREAGAPAAARRDTPSRESATPVTSPTDPTPTPTGQTPATEPQAPAASDTASAAAPSAGEQAGPGAGADTDRVREHLSAARNALAALTRLPAATEIAGESRTRVSQLITDFNAMIATETAWQASLEKVKSNLETILSAPAQTPAVAEPADTGAVGTSGQHGLDPEIRAKLVEFRTHLLAFEQAMSARSPATAGASATGAEPMNPPSIRSSGDSPRGVAAPRAGDARVPGHEAGPQPEAAHQDALRHIDAIEAVLAAAPDRAARAEPPLEGERSDLRPVGTSGSTPPAPGAALGADEIVQIREHLRELRDLLAGAR